jgi:hypothetical protein
MKLFFDLRLGYFVAAPGQESEIALLEAKAGDTEEIIVQFGRSSDPTSASAIVTAPTWTAENLAGGTAITIGIKESGDYSDGDILATTSTFTHNSTDKLYTFSLDHNTTEINTALGRNSGSAANDIAELDCEFELTFQVGGSGGWRSNTKPVPYTLYHDILGGSEGTPTEAADPDEYLLKAAAAEFYSTVTSKTGGTAADLDAVPTVAVTVGKLVQFVDQDASPYRLRHYRLKAGTDAESSPDIIQPDDYNASTNAKVWELVQIDGDLLLPSTVSQAEAEAGTSTTERLWTAERVNQAIKALEDPTVAEPPNGLSSSVANEIVLFNGTDGKQLKRATTTGILKATSGVIAAAVAGTDVVTPGAITTRGITMSTARLIGRTTASTGAPEEITVGTGLTLSGGTLTASDNSLPSSIVTLTTDTTLVVGTHNTAYVECTGAMTTVTIANQATSTWTANSHFWIVNRLASGSVTIARGAGVTLILSGTTSADITLASGTRAIHIWRSASDVWRVIS